MDMLAWWWELQAIPNMEDHQELTWKVRASFEVPMVWSWAQGGENDYCAPPAPKSIGKDRFLPPLDPWMGSQDYCLGQPMKTLGYAKALQYWVERAKPPIPSESCQLAGSILELRQAMKPFMTFKDSEVLRSNTVPWGCDVCHNCWAHPRGSLSVAYSRRWPGPSIGHIAQTSVLATPLGETLL